MRSPRKTWVAVTTVTLALLLTITACGNSKGSDPLAAGTSAAPSAAAGTIVVGSASFPESTLIANIYMAALQAKGVKVSSKFAIGNREAYLPGLSDGSIDLIPEYTGNLLQSYDKSYTAETSDQVYSQLKTKLPSDLLVLDQSKAQDTDSVVVTKATATKYNLKSIADLAPVAGQLTLGGSAEWKTRPKSGIPALKSVYGVTLQELHHPRRRRQALEERAEDRPSAGHRHLQHRRRHHQERLGRARGPEGDVLGAERRPADQQGQGDRHRHDRTQRRVRQDDDRRSARAQRRGRRGQGPGRRGQGMAEHAGPHLSMGPLVTTISGTLGRDAGDALPGPMAAMTNPIWLGGPAQA